MTSSIQLAQTLAYQWAERCFGSVEASDPVQRGLRHVEEAIELAQACRVPADQVRALVDHIYSRPPGDTAQEIGGAALTLAVLCEAGGYSLEARLQSELSRVLEKPVEHFKARNAEKNAAGFRAKHLIGSAP